MKRLILYLFSSAFFITSCNDHLKIEKNNDPQGYADSQFVGTWKITSINSDVAWDWDNNGTTETNIFATQSSCQQDNLYTFVGDKTGTFKLSCSLTKDGSWQIVNTQYLLYTPTGLAQESEKVISMTSVQFKTALDLTLPNGQPATITKTWSRQ
jgi:hypothetical protein